VLRTVGLGLALAVLVACSTTSNRHTDVSSAVPISEKECPGIVGPVLLSAPQAEYPLELRQAHLEASVILQGIINTDGTVTFVRVIKSSNVRFTGLAVARLEKILYKPATCAGVPVKVYVTMTSEFSLKK
jgi:TonB family protein